MCHWSFVAQAFLVFNKNLFHLHASHVESIKGNRLVENLENRSTNLGTWGFIYMECHKNVWGDGQSSNIQERWFPILFWGQFPVHLGMPGRWNLSMNGFDFFWMGWFVYFLVMVYQQRHKSHHLGKNNCWHVFPNILIKHTNLCLCHGVIFENPAFQWPQDSSRKFHTRWCLEGGFVRPGVSKFLFITASYLERPAGLDQVHLGFLKIFSFSTPSKIAAKKSRGFWGFLMIFVTTLKCFVGPSLAQALGYPRNDDRLGSEQGQQRSNVVTVKLAGT